MVHKRVDTHIPSKRSDKMPEAKTKEIKIILPDDLISILLPNETHRHLLNARKEMLLAFRSLIDAKIDALEKTDLKKETKSRKIKIE